MLVSNVPLPAGTRTPGLKTADGKRLVPYAQRVEISDPSLQATFDEYPDHAVNYEYQSRKVKVADGSQQDDADAELPGRVIPRSQPSALNGNAMQQNAAPPKRRRRPGGRRIRTCLRGPGGSAGWGN